MDGDDEWEMVDALGCGVRDLAVTAAEGPDDGWERVDDRFDQPPLGGWTGFSRDAMHRYVLYYGGYERNGAEGHFYHLGFGGDMLLLVPPLPGHVVGRSCAHSCV